MMHGKKRNQLKACNWHRIISNDNSEISRFMKQNYISTDKKSEYDENVMADQNQVDKNDSDENITLNN